MLIARGRQGFFDAHPQFARRFPGGVVQFVQFAAQMDEGTLEEMMLDVVAGAGMGEDAGEDEDGAGALGMPGGMEVYEAEFTDEEEGGGDDGEDEEEGAAVSAP